jgi:hypothetical protein
MIRWGRKPGTSELEVGVEKVERVDILDNILTVGRYSFFIDK